MRPPPRTRPSRALRWAGRARRDCRVARRTGRSVVTNPSNRSLRTRRALHHLQTVRHGHAHVQSFDGERQPPRRQLRRPSAAFVFPISRLVSNVWFHRSPASPPLPAPIARRPDQVAIVRRPPGLPVTAKCTASSRFVLPAPVSPWTTVVSLRERPATSVIAEVAQPGATIWNESRPGALASVGRKRLGDSNRSLHVRRTGMIRCRKLPACSPSSPPPASIRPGLSGLISFRISSSTSAVSGPSWRNCGLKPISSGSPAVPDQRRLACLAYVGVSPRPSASPPRTSS